MSGAKYNIQRMNLATNNIRTLPGQSWSSGITLDYTNKRVYWIEGERHIFSSDYDFQHLKSIRNGSFRPYVLAISGDSLYFQNTGVLSINQMNVSNGKSVRSILVDKSMGTVNGYVIKYNNIAEYLSRLAYRR